ncbi:Unknown protein, partial [Striga hermonthica]
TGISRIPIDVPRIRKEGPKKRTEELPSISRDSRDGRDSRESHDSRVQQSRNDDFCETSRDSRVYVATREMLSRLASS